MSDELGEWDDSIFKKKVDLGDLDDLGGLDNTNDLDNTDDLDVSDIWDYIFDSFTDIGTSQPNRINTTGNRSSSWNSTSIS